MREIRQSGSEGGDGPKGRFTIPSPPVLEELAKSLVR